MKKALALVFAAVLGLAVQAVAATSIHDIHSQLSRVGGVNAVTLSYSVTGETANLGNKVYWGPTVQPTPSNYPNSLDALPYGIVPNYQRQFTIPAFPVGSTVYMGIVFKGGAAGTDVQQTTLTLPTATSTPTPRSTVTVSPTPTETPTATPTPTAVPTYAAGSHIIYESFNGVTVNQTNDFTLGYLPTGPVGIVIVDVTTGRLVSTVTIPFVAPAQLNAVSEASPKLWAYTLLLPQTLRLRLGSKNASFITGHVYQFNFSYVMVTP